MDDEEGLGNGQISCGLSSSQRSTRESADELNGEAERWLTEMEAERTSHPPNPSANNKKKVRRGLLGRFAYTRRQRDPADSRLLLKGKAMPRYVNGEWLPAAEELPLADAGTQTADCREMATQTGSRVAKHGGGATRGRSANAARELRWSEEGDFRF